MVIADDCPQENAVGSIVLGSVLTVGIFLSYLPQHISIIRAKTSEGLSLFMLLLSNLSALTIVLFSVVREWDTYACCTVVGFAQCQRILLELYQLLVGFVNLLPMYGLAIYYHPFGPRNIDRFVTSQMQTNKLGAEQTAKKRYLFDVVVFLAYLAFTVSMILVAVVMTQSLGSSSPAVKTLSSVMGLGSVVSTFLIWLPQIYSVYALKGPGSLSVLMLLLQAPGALAVAIYQGALQHEGWGVWVPYVAVFVQEVIILLQVLWYWWKARNAFSIRAPDMLSLLDVGDPDLSPDIDEQLSDAPFDHGPTSTIFGLMGFSAKPKQDIDLELMQPPSDDDIYDQVFESDED